MQNDIIHNLQCRLSRLTALNKDYPEQGWTNPECLAARATKFSTVAPNFCGS
jgi:hypothetical protein